MKICGMDHWFLVSTHVRAHVHTPRMNPQYDNGHPSREATVNLKKALPLPTPSSLSLQISSSFYSPFSKGKEGLFACMFKERKREQELSNCLKPLGWLWGKLWHRQPGRCGVSQTAFPDCVRAYCSSRCTRKDGRIESVMQRFIVLRNGMRII